MESLDSFLLCDLTITERWDETFHYDSGLAKFYALYILGGLFFKVYTRLDLFYLPGEVNLLS